MTPETRETLTALVRACRDVLGFAKSWEPLTPGDLADLQRATDAADAALRDVLTPRTCGTCRHADIDGALRDGWCFCAAPDGPRFPFYARSMPLDERCKGWQARKGEGGTR